MKRLTESQRQLYIKRNNVAVHINSIRRDTNILEDMVNDYDFDVEDMHTVNTVLAQISSQLRSVLSPLLAMTKDVEEPEQKELQP